MLMENTPTPDFEMNFYSGTKVQHSVTKKRLKITMAKSSSKEPETFIIDLTNTSPQIHPSIQTLFIHVQDCLKQCLEIEKNSGEDSSIAYPLVLKSSSLNLGEKVNPPSPIQSIHPSTISSYSTINPTTTRSNEPIKSSRMTSQSRERERPNRYAPSESTRSRLNSQPLTNRTNQTFPGQSKELESRSVIGKKFINGVGWCIKYAPNKSSEYQTSNDGEGMFCMCFNDGIALNVYVKEHFLVYDDGRVERRYPIDRDLPGDVKRRLAYLPKFMKLYQD